MDGVLGTDVSHHFEYLSKFENRMAGGLTNEKLEKKEDVLLVLTYVIKCADMSNPSRPPRLNRLWVDRVMNEFFEQGDLEKDKSFDVTMFYDRQKPNVAKCQTGFIDFLVRPMYLKFINFAQNEAARHTLDVMEENYLFWKQAQAAPVPVPSPHLSVLVSPNIHSMMYCLSSADLFLSTFFLRPPSGKSQVSFFLSHFFLSL